MEGGPGRLRRMITSPVVLILLIAPYFGEGLSGSTPPLELVLPWNLAFMAALYGCGALVCREFARRFGLGFPGLCLLAVAYGVWEEALVDRYWFFPTFWQDSGIGEYSVVWHTNVLVALHLTAFHAVISIGSSVLVVEWLAPAFRDRPWVGRRGLTLAVLALAVTPIPCTASSTDDHRCRSWPPQRPCSSLSLSPHSWSHDRTPFSRAALRPPTSTPCPDARGDVV